MPPAIHDEKSLRSRLAPVIVGADFCAYAYTRCLWEAYGVTSIELAVDNLKFLSTSRFIDYHTVPDITQHDAFLKHLRTLGKRLLAQGKVPLLLSCGDRYARMISQNKTELSQWYYVPYIDFSLLDDITQKENFYRLCEKFGMHYPKSRFLDCSDPDTAADDSGFTYPVIAKPSNSAAYYDTKIPNKKKVFLLHDHDELATLLDDLKNSSYDKSLILQDYIPGADTNILSITIYTDRNGDPVFTVGARVVLEDHSPFAIGNPVVAISQPREQMQPIFDEALRFLKAVGYHGISNFDVMYDQRDKTYKFLEINTRPGRNTFYVYQAGINFARLIVQDFVLHQDMHFLPGDKPFVLTVVPKYVVSRSVADPRIRERVLTAYKDRTAQSPIAWKKDRLTQKFWAKVNYYHQIDKFRKYVWSEEGRRENV